MPFELRFFVWYSGASPKIVTLEFNGEDICSDDNNNNNNNGGEDGTTVAEGGEESTTNTESATTTTTTPATRSGRTCSLIIGKGN